MSSREDFIAGAKKPRPNKRTKDILYPWNEEHVRADVEKRFSLRLPEPLYLKLKYIGELKGSMNQFCKEILEPAIEDEIEKLEG